MAGPQKTVLDLPWSEGAQEAAAAPGLSPSLKGSLRDDPLHQGLLRPARRLCSPTLPPTKSPKKPKMQSPGEMFPTDWSPPPVSFLQAPPGPTGHQWVGAVRPPRELRREPQDSDSPGSLASLEELFWSMAGPSQPAAAPEAEGHGEFSGSAERYANSLDYLLQEKREQALEQERERLLLQDCLDLNSLDLDRGEAPLTPEHRRLVERFSVSLQDIPSVHPGEVVFLPRGDPLPCALDSSLLKPRSPLEELFLSSPPDQQLSFLHSGLLSNLYLHAPGCLAPLLQWLFQLLTWPPETSSRAFGLLWDLSVDGLFQQSDDDIRLWYPSIQEVAEALRSLGACGPADPDPHALGPAQQGGRALGPEAGLKGQEAALDISLGYIYKFLALCALAQPGARSDADLVGLMELLCRAGLDVGLRLVPNSDLQQLLLLLLDRIREWPGQLQPLCSALSRVSDHHHNLLALVQLFLDVTSRSRQLRGQLSLVVIARMLGQPEAPLLWQEKTQLSLLGRLLSLMKPSSLAQHLGAGPLPPCQKQQPKASAELDHQVCYLCHSLLTLAGLVVSSQDITPDQWGELQLLCMQLDRHISTHIRESPQAMYRTKLKDLATQTYVRWQELLAHCQPQAQYFSPWKDL